jgi:hypothetical protein
MYTTIVMDVVFNAMMMNMTLVSTHVIKHLVERTKKLIVHTLKTSFVKFCYFICVTSETQSGKVRIKSNLYL